MIHATSTLFSLALPHLIVTYVCLWPDHVSSVSQCLLDCADFNQGTLAEDEAELDRVEADSISSDDDVAPEPAKDQSSYVACFLIVWQILLIFL